ncbi:CatA-like O-acetyltransferase, family 3 [Pectinatus sottacetonis]|uniref:CatA-like O-acetyltransferase, family 3 n=1 Tax=Pectinatus sottacetonis TaxID=1002795 RepID=UPI0018C5B1E2|nr:CatA-like O-acetyltransferase, family 3 [Pectinatus sottacetonis]
MNYKIINMDKYYRRGVFRHFSEDCKCSISMTSHLDVTVLKKYSQDTKTKFYINFLYILAKTLNSREDYRMGYFWQTQQVVIYDKINPTHYIFHKDTETCTPVYSQYQNDYVYFYAACAKDIVKAKQSQKYALDIENHPNWFDASYISWLSYDSMHVELPDGYLYFMPIVNWGRYHEENNRLIMPVSVRLNHAAADGYLLAKVFLLLQEEILKFTQQK